MLWKNLLSNKSYNRQWGKKNPWYLSDITNHSAFMRMYSSIQTIYSTIGMGFDADAGCSILSLNLTFPSIIEHQQSCDFFFTNKEISVRVSQTQRSERKLKPTTRMRLKGDDKRSIHQLCSLNYLPFYEILSTYLTK